MTKMTAQQRIMQLQEEIATLRTLADQEAARLRDSVTPQYQFTVFPADSTWDVIHDDTCFLYQVSGTVINKDELSAVGARSPMEGAMKYIYNSGTKRIVSHVGGGTTFTSSPEFMAALAAFIDSTPSGGDITELVSRYRGGK